MTTSLINILLRIHILVLLSKEKYNMVQVMIKKDNERLANTPKNSKYPLTNLVYCSTCKRPNEKACS